MSRGLPSGVVAQVYRLQPNEKKQKEKCTLACMIIFGFFFFFDFRLAGNVVGRREENRDRRRRRERQNVSFARVFRGRVSDGVRADGVRQFFDIDRTGRETGETRAVGHGRPGGLRPAAAALVSQFGRGDHMLFDRQARFVDQRGRQMDPRSPVFHQGRAGDTGRQQEGPPRSISNVAPAERRGRRGRR